MDDEARYRAVRSRDPRFDGIFYTGVTTTGIFCRPSCPARTPNRSNVRFFRSAAHAVSAGLRACRRCRPDVVPGAPEWNLRADLAGRAVRLVTDGVVDREGVAGLSARLGYSERQVHRTLVDELGAGPLRLSRTQRAHTARLLLETTDLPVTEIAFAAGFASIRQFNATIQEVYAATPTQLRASRRSEQAATPGTIELRLAHREPADITGVLAFHAAHGIAGVEAVRHINGDGLGSPGGNSGGTGTAGVATGGERSEGLAFIKALDLPYGPAVVELAAEQGSVRANLRLNDLRDLAAAVARCRRLLDLDADTTAVDLQLAGDPALAPLIAAAPGLRVPGSVDGGEMAVRTVLGQQISVAAARRIGARLVETYGTRLPEPIGGVTHTFPTAAALAAADPDDFPMTRARARTLHELAMRLADGRLVLDPGVDRDEAEHRLLAITGIGPWTAGYVRMRALGDPDVFLPTDLGIKRALTAVGLPSDPRCAAERAATWRPWRSYALMHLWRLA